jgi:hypothetical protein
MAMDPRGGHNRKYINEDFFKAWTPPMAYTLGFIYADGALINASKSSRTQYIVYASNDKELLEDVKRVMDSRHKIYMSPSRFVSIRGKLCFQKTGYKLRIGSKHLYQDLIALGLTPKKSLVMKFPYVPAEFLSYFVRGYFDGDGCVHLTRTFNKADKLKLIYISGSKLFVDELRALLVKHAGCGVGCLYKEDGAYRLQYNIRDGLRIMDFMYRNLNDSPFLKRKYEIYQKCLTTSIDIK